MMNKNVNETKSKGTNVPTQLASNIKTTTQPARNSTTQTRPNAMSSSRPNRPVGSNANFQRGTMTSRVTNTSTTTGPRNAGINTQPRGERRDRFSAARRARSSSRMSETVEDISSHILHTRRVTKVVKGGKNMSFYVLSVVGNKKGMVGLGEGKSRTIVNAINKSFHNAKKNMFTVDTIRPVKHKFKSTQIILKRNRGSQIIAANNLYNIFVLAGIRGISCKIIASHNVINSVKCLFECFRMFRSHVSPSLESPTVQTKTYRRNAS